MTIHYIEIAKDKRNYKVANYQVNKKNDGAKKIVCSLDIPANIFIFVKR